MLPDILNYIPDPKNGRPIADGQVYFFLGGYSAPTNIADVDASFIAQVTANGNPVPQPIYTSKGGTLIVGSQTNQPQLNVDPLVKRVAVYDKCGRLVYSTAYNGVGAFVDADTLAAPDSTVLVGGVEASKLVVQVASLKSLQTTGLVNGRQHSVAGFYVGASTGGGLFIWDAGRDKADHDGGTVISPEALDAWDGTESDILTLLNWSVAGLGCYVRKIDNDYLKPSQFGAKESIANNAPMIQRCYDSAASLGLELKYDLMYPTTDTINYTIANMCTSGIGQPRWRDASALDVGIQYNGTTAAPAILITQGTSRHRWYKVRGTRNAAGAHNIQLGETGVVSACTIMDFEGIASQRAGGAGYAILGNNAGESCRWIRGESSGNVGSGVYLFRGDTSMNNTVFDKFNSHRNGADGFNFASGVQRLLITGGCDMTLNSGAGVAFRGSVDFDSVIENNWFENNGTDILLDCDTSARGVTSRNNKLAEAADQAIYCKNGRIKSFGDKFNNTPIGVKFDVADAMSIVHPGSVVSVPTFYSGNTSFLSHLPFEGCVLREHHFTINNVAASLTNQIIPKLSGGTAYDIPQKALFYRVRARLTGVTVTTGSMTIHLVKNTATNRCNALTTIIDSTVTNGNKQTVSLFGNNTFTSSSAFDNFFLVYTTTADWNGTAGRVDVIVESIDLA